MLSHGFRDSGSGYGERSAHEIGKPIFGTSQKDMSMVIQLLLNTSIAKINVFLGSGWLTI
jgi:hypothetical protein